MSIQSEFDANYEKYQKGQIEALGFDPDKLTADQKDILLQPMDAPENYHHDGEVSSSEAKQIWSAKMKKAGFTPLKISIVAKAMGL